MKPLFTIIALLISQFLIGQFRPGTYRIISDSNDLFGNYFSELIFKEDNTYIYLFRTPSCSMWYDSEGSWETNEDSLVLKDEVISFGWPVRFWSTDTCENGVFITVKNKDGSLIQGAKIKYVFLNSKDTNIAYSNSYGKAFINTAGIPEQKKEGKFRVVDDISFVLEFYSEKTKKTIWGNNFSTLNENIICIVDEDAKNETVIRTTTYEIKNSFLNFIHQEFSKPDVSPLHHLYGNFKYKTE